MYKPWQLANQIIFNDFKSSATTDSSRSDVFLFSHIEDHAQQLRWRSYRKGAVCEEETTEGVEAVEGLTVQAPYVRKRQLKV